MRRGTRGRGFGGGGRPPHRPQMNIPRQLQPPQSQSSGPLMTGHLHGLKDIDMELELLKRKREIIEQQQEILSNSYRDRNEYEQPFSYMRESRYDDYTRLYDNARDEYGGGRGLGGGRKRPYNIPVWEHEATAPPKRFSGPTRGGRPFGSRPGPSSNLRPAERAPEPRFPAPKQQRRPPPQSQKKKNFNPTKVAKPSPAPPLKLSSYQPAERKKLVNAAMSSATVRPGPKPREECLLRADREPSRKVAGRLELGLGAIMKDIKNSNPQFEHLFKSPTVMRAMKSVVRQRVRVAMIGKEVSNIDHIKAAYYNMYPLTDNHVVMTGLECHENKKFLVVDTDNPETYFKKNLQRLMTMRMEEMINKLQDIYGSGALIPTRDSGKQKYKQNQRQSKVVAEGSQTNEAESDVNSKTNDEVLIQDENAQLNTEGEQKDETQPKSDDSETKNDETLDIAKEQVIIESSAEKPGLEQANIDTPADVKTEPAKETNTDTSAEVLPEPIQEQASADTSTAEVIVKSLEEMQDAQKDEKTLELINTEQYVALDNLMTHKMLHLLKKFTPDFVKLMDVNKMYRDTKSAIIIETKRKMGKTPWINPVSTNVETIQDPPGNKQNAPPTKEKPERPRYPTPLKYYVKIFGKPALPKRKSMEGFFKDFQPKSIKKHKTIHNLLFVGFTDKEAFEKMLAADGTVFGRYTLDIKISERNTDNKNNPNKTMASVDGAQGKNLDDSMDNIIGADLDSQITDLLTSIRKSEEVENFAEDIVIAEPPAAVAHKQNGDEASKADPEVIDCDEEQNANDDDVVKLEDVPQDNDDIVEVKLDAPNNDVVEIQDEPENGGNVVDPENGGNVVESENKEVETIIVEEKDTVSALKDVKATPTRASARLATPSGIRTRRMSKLTE